MYKKLKVWLKNKINNLCKEDDVITDIKRNNCKYSHIRKELKQNEKTIKNK